MTTNRESGQRFVPLRAQLALLMSVAVLLFGLLNLLVVGWLSFKSLSREQERRLEFVAELLAQRAQEPLLFDNRVALDRMVRQSKSIDPDIAYILISDATSQLVAHTFETAVPGWVSPGRRRAEAVRGVFTVADDDGDNYREMERPILRGQLGKVRVGMAEARIRHEVANLLSILALMVTVLLVTGLLATRLVALRVTRPLEKISAALEGFQLDGPALRLRLETGDELSLVAAKMETMASRLQELYEQERQRDRELMRVERLAALGTLSAGIAHEVNNPLAGIKNAAQRLAKTADDPNRVERYREVISSSVDRIERIIRRTLSLSRIERARIRRVDLASSIERAVELARPRLDEVGAEVKIIKGPEPLIVETDSDIVEQVVLNLLLNAADAVEMNDEGVQRRVEVLVERAVDGRVVLRVRDSGPGVPAAIEERIFDPFYTTKGAGKGTGLGLAVSWRAAREIGGELELESRGGPGATFRFVLGAEEAEA